MRTTTCFEEYSLKNSLSARITPAIVENQMVNIDHVLFQVTADCNLQCRYCCYGELYENPIHHSDRGVQYTSVEYVQLHRTNHIEISMTQDEDPLHNALAERMNNTLKNRWLFNDSSLSFEQAWKAIEQAVLM